MRPRPETGMRECESTRRDETRRDRVCQCANVPIQCANAPIQCAKGEERRGERDETRRGRKKRCDDEMIRGGMLFDPLRSRRPEKLIFTNEADRLIATRELDGAIDVGPRDPDGCLSYEREYYHNRDHVISAVINHQPSGREKMGNSGRRNGIADDGGLDPACVKSMRMRP